MVKIKNVSYEVELYSPMCAWLKTKLLDKYKNQDCEIYAIDCHARALDAVLEEYGILDYYPQSVGLGIQIDVLGIAKFANKADIFFIEAKKESLNLHHLGQLWAYCKLCNPLEAYLLSSAGLGSLDKILKNLGRTDLLDFGFNQENKKIVVARWDIQRDSVDYHSAIPQI